MSVKSKKSFVSFIAWILSFFSVRHIRTSNEDLKKAEFKTSTQRLGIRFSEKFRDVFRFKWLRKKHSGQ
jgi:hypothetical protein